MKRKRSKPAPVELITSAEAINELRALNTRIYQTWTYLQNERFFAAANVFDKPLGKLNQALRDLEYNRKKIFREAAENNEQA